MKQLVFSTFWANSSSSEWFRASSVSFFQLNSLIFCAVIFLMLGHSSGSNPVDLSIALNAQFPPYKTSILSKSLMFGI